MAHEISNPKATDFSRSGDSGVTIHTVCLFAWQSNPRPCLYIRVEWGWNETTVSPEM